jgi:hypothetical protein
MMATSTLDVNCISVPNEIWHLRRLEIRGNLAFEEIWHSR